MLSMRYLLYVHPPTVGYSSVEFVTHIIYHLESFERMQLNSYYIYVISCFRDTVTRQI